MRKLKMHKELRCIQKDFFMQSHQDRKENYFDFEKDISEANTV
jgi:hypothetical protein